MIVRGKLTTSTALSHCMQADDEQQIAQLTARNMTWRSRIRPLQLTTIPCVSCAVCRAELHVR